MLRSQVFHQNRRHIRVHDSISYFVHEFLFGIFAAALGPEERRDLLQFL